MNFRVEVKTVDTPEAAWEALRAAGGDGWVCTASAVARLDGGLLSPEIDDLPLLAAEVANGNTTTTVRYDGRRWAVATLIRGEGAPHTVQTVVLRSIDPRVGHVEGIESGPVTYEVFWPVTPVTNLAVGTALAEPTATRFVGFGDLREGSR
ncbi:MAG: hypothetical protein H6706_00920 [Myxococcales bacterium]|nr:hypothetical protein [Myxococcales bacterium]